MKNVAWPKRKGKASSLLSQRSLSPSSFLPIKLPSQSSDQQLIFRRSMPFSEKLRLQIFRQNKKQSSASFGFSLRRASTVMPAPLPTVRASWWKRHTLQASSARLFVPRTWVRPMPAFMELAANSVTSQPISLIFRTKERHIRTCSLKILR